MGDEAGAGGGSLLPVALAHEAATNYCGKTCNDFCTGLIDCSCDKSRERFLRASGPRFLWLMGAGSVHVVSV